MTVNKRAGTFPNMAMVSCDLGARKTGHRLMDVLEASHARSCVASADLDAWRSQQRRRTDGTTEFVERLPGNTAALWYTTHGMLSIPSSYTRGHALQQRGARRLVWKRCQERHLYIQRASQG